MQSSVNTRGPTSLPVLWYTYLVQAILPATVTSTSARLCQKMKRTACIFAIAAASVSQAQDYGDYAGQDDNLYADYAAKQQEKAVGAGG